MIVENGRFQIVDAPLTVTLMSFLQSLDNLQLYAKMHMVIISSQYTVAMYSHLQLEAFSYLKCWSATEQRSCEKCSVGLLCTSAFGRQFAACRSIHLFFYIYSPTSSPFHIQHIILEFHNISLANFNTSTICPGAVLSVMDLHK